MYSKVQTRWSPERRPVQTLHRGSHPYLPGNGHWGTNRRYYVNAIACADDIALIADDKCDL
jgi:hypothetical protein